MRKAIISIIAGLFVAGVVMATETRMSFYGPLSDANNSVGTNGQVLTSTGTSTSWKSNSYTNGIFSKNIADGSGSTTSIPHNLGRTPSSIILNCIVGNTVMSLGSYNGSTYATTYLIGGTLPSSSNSILASLNTTISNSYTSVISSTTTTNAVLTWTAVNSPTGIAQCTWLAN